MTQNTRLLAYLKRHHYITRRDAAVKLGIMNLWARASEIESQGHSLDRRIVHSRTGKRVMQYWLRQGKARKAA